MRDLPLPYLNKQLEDAKRLFMERHPSSKKKDQTSLIPPGFQPLTPSGLPGVGDPPPVHYTVACNNPNVEVATPSGHGLDLHDNPDAVWKDLSHRAGRAATPLTPLADEAPSGRDPPPNRLRLTLAPRGSGTYPVRLTLTSAYDTRVVLVTFVAQVRPAPPVSYPPTNKPRNITTAASIANRDNIVGGALSEKLATRDGSHLL